MGESFEAVLTARSSKETFRKAKSALRNGELVCCSESSPGVLRAVFRDARGNVSRVEARGFPSGPFSSVCSCTEDPHAFCHHALAACLYHAKYTIKPQETVPEDSPAQYAGLKFLELPELMQQVMQIPSAQVELSTESDFPHMPSKWEKIRFSMTLLCGGRKYTGSLNNLRQLHFGKTLSVTLHLESFPQQDRQIIRYLAIHAEQDGSFLLLDSEQTAEFFHCLIHFPRFFRKKENVVIHQSRAYPAILVEDAPSGCVLRSAVIVKGVPLPLQDVKVIAGRAGCWVGMLGEYWWVCAQADVLWVRNFLRTTVQTCDRRSAEVLLQANWLPLKVIETRKVKVSQRKFRPFYSGAIRPDGALEVELFYDYGGRICPGDRERYASAGGSYFLRDCAGEEKIADELIHFGFEMKRASSSSARRTKLILRDREAIGIFTDEVIPRWLRQKRDFILSSELTSLCGDLSSLRISCRLMDETPDHFDLEITLHAGGVPLAWSTLCAAAVRNENFMSAGDGTFVRIPLPLRKLASSMADILRSVPSKERRKREAGTEIFRLPRPAAYHWAKLAEGLPGASPNEFLRIRNDWDLTLEDLASDAGSFRPEVFRGTLRNYQAQGVRWLSVMGKRGCNLILADEMGLGKTIQTLALLASDAGENLPALIICPTSLTENWARESARFTPELKMLVIAGPDRSELWKTSDLYDVCVTSYSLIRRDVPLLAGRRFRYLILDEAQHIKNPATANAQSCRSIAADRKLVLTGTPLENSPDDLWSIFEFLHPGFLGGQTSFRALCERDPGEVASRIAPFLLRRRKEDVSLELPPKQEQCLRCAMGPEQQKLYDRFLAEGRTLLEKMKHGENSVHFEVLSLLLRLRQICCAPELLGPELTGSTVPPPSAKMELLKEVLLEAVDSHHKVLLFSQFTSLLALVRKWMDAEGLAYEYLDGSTTDRMSHVDRFNHSPEIPVFLLSLKAGGTGLNLTGADTVILYDPWWNPAVELQAEDRTHRIGQTRNVNCLKLIVRDSVEEKVLELQKRKADLFRNFVESPSEAMRKISMEDLEFLLKEDF